MAALARGAENRLAARRPVNHRHFAAAAAAVLVVSDSETERVA